MTAVADLKDYLLAPERDDARRRLADPGYWGDTGAWVLGAVAAVEAAVDRVPPGGGAPAWLTRLAAELADAHAAYRRDAADPDGYGSATFAACRARLQRLLDEAGP